MDENQQPSVQQELERLLLCRRGGRKEDESRELHKIGASESSTLATSDTNTNFAKPCTTNGTDVEGIKNMCRFPVSFLFFLCKTQRFQFSSLVFHDCRLNFSKQKQKLSYFKPFQSRPNGI